jgi:hypothetical protein
MNMALHIGKVINYSDFSVKSDVLGSSGISARLHCAVFQKIVFLINYCRTARGHGFFQGVIPAFKDKFS